MLQDEKNRLHIFQSFPLFVKHQMINQTLLSNRRAYADLHCRLLMTDVEREKRLHTQWMVRMEDWKRLQTDLACEAFT